MAGMDDGRIVVGVDVAGTSDEAIMWAADTAALRRVPLVLAHALAEPSSEWGSQQITPERVRAAAENLLRTKRDDVFDAHPELTVHIEVTTASAEDAVLTQAQRAGLVVVGSRHRGPVGRLFLGSVSHAAVTRSPVPVAVVRHRAENPGAPVVVGVEYDEMCGPSLAYAFREAADRKVELRAVRAWTPDIAIGYGVFVLDAEVLGSLRDEAQRELDSVVEKHAAEHPEVQVRTAIVQGDPTTVLVDAAADAQLLVVGSHGRGTLGRLLLGSVSTNVLHAVSNPVVIVPGERQS